MNSHQRRKVRRAEIRRAWSSYDRIFPGIIYCDDPVLHGKRVRPGRIVEWHETHRAVADVGSIVIKEVRDVVLIKGMIGSLDSVTYT